MGNRKKDYYVTIYKGEALIWKDWYKCEKFQADNPGKKIVKGFYSKRDAEVFAKDFGAELFPNIFEGEKARDPDGPEIDLNPGRPGTKTDFILKDGSRHAGIVELVRYLVKKEVKKQLKQTTKAIGRIEHSGPHPHIG
jgi:hypothetical protein